jgi:hypothetical protein
MGFLQEGLDLLFVLKVNSLLKFYSENRYFLINLACHIDIIKHLLKN